MADELFWTKWSAIGQILGAMGTFAAVVVSLYLARRAEKPKLKLRAGIRLVIGGGATAPFPKIIDITVRNAGSLTAHVSQFGWQTGRWFLRRPKWLVRQHAIQLPGTTGYGMNPPFELPPGTSRSMILDHDNFFDAISTRKSGPLFARRWPLLGIRRTAVYVVAHLESGVTLKERVEQDFEHALAQAEAVAPKVESAQPVVTNER